MKGSRAGVVVILQAGLEAGRKAESGYETTVFLKHSEGAREFVN